MLLPPHNSLCGGGHIYVDDNTLHVQSGITILVRRLDISLTRTGERI